MEVSGQLHASAALPQQKKNILVSHMGDCMGKAGLEAFETREIPFLSWGRSTILRSSGS